MIALHYQTLKNTDLTLSAVCFGAAPLGSVISEQDSFSLLDAFADAGGNFIDTAVLYGSGGTGGEESLSEKTIGKWFKHTSHRMIVATKGAHYDLATKRSRVTPEDIIQDAEKSLLHLGLDRIDLYYLHRDDEGRPVSEIMDTLFFLRKAGKLRHLACSNWTAERVKQANEYAAQKGEEGFAAISNRWSLARFRRSRQDDPTLVFMSPEEYRYHLQTGIAAIPYTAMANGYLSRLAFAQPMPQSMSCYQQAPENQEICRRVRELAIEKNASIAQIALAYLINQPFVTIPVVSTSRISHLKEILQGTGVVLSQQELSYLNGVS